MMKLLSHDIRRKFIDFFSKKHGHMFVKSSSIKLPDNDTISFTNAGMNQFRDVFMSDNKSYDTKRICSYQKCVRVGGKMCDLDQVGKDFRHHTFFEMLGNWSFNDYGKNQACEWALDFLVNQMDLDQSKLSVTYFSSPNEVDIETAKVWKKLGFCEDQIMPNHQGDNFWEMGKSGPCGISTEIFYSHETQVDKLELWNLVFIDRQRLKETGDIVALKNSKFIDTGLGLERLLSVIENVESNYDTELFKPLIGAIESKSPSVKHYKGSLSELDINYRILADHCRMITIALADGIVPGRKGAAFDLRKIIKRVTLISRDIFKQSVPRYLLFDLVDETVRLLQPAYPELSDSIKQTRRILASETKRYLSHLESAPV